MRTASLLAALVCVAFGVAACDAVAVSDHAPASAPRLTVEAWEWTGGVGMRCRDGSETGFALRRGTVPKLLIMLDGGGFCFDSLSCTRTAGNNHYTETDFRGEIAEGRFDRGIYADDGRNPFRDWDVAFVPYCTGDLHAGDATDVTVEGLDTPQQFVGYHNTLAMLDALSAALPASPAHVVLAGISAGAGGVVTTYGLVADHFEAGAGGPVPVDFLADSLPLPADDRVLSDALQERWQTLWNLSTALPDDCPDCTGPDGLEKLIPYYAGRYPDNSFGITSYLSDCIIRGNLGALNTNIAADAGCDARPGVRFTEFVPRQRYKTALGGIRSGLTSAGRGNAATYYVNGVTHGFLGGGGLYATTVSQAGLAVWVDSLIAGRAAHVYPGSAPPW